MPPPATLEPRLQAVFVAATTESMERLEALVPTGRRELRVVGGREA